MGPDHPQIEIYEESKHGIAFHANKEIMALDSESWILGKDYSAAPTCSTCHISGYMTPQGAVDGGTHDVGDRISWTLRPVISSKLNRVTDEDGFKEDFPHTRELPAVGDTLATSEKVVEHEQMVTRTVDRTVKQIVTWEERRAAKQFMDDLKADGVLKPDAPFEHEVQWVFWELWHHEGRRARHGASMMGPDYTHWHGMYEVSKHYYTEFLPAVVEAAESKSHELGEKYRGIIEEMMTNPEHAWQKGLSPEEAERLRRAYQERYNQ